MKLHVTFAVVGLALTQQYGCRNPDSQHSTPQPMATSVAAPAAAGNYVGFDRNDYPGDDRLAELHQHFAYTSYWLTPPPEETANSWVGRRAVVRQAGFGFVLLANGRLDTQIKHAAQAPEVLGKADGVAAVESARREGFPAGAIIFLDQEEGGRLLPEQAAYFFGWTEAVAGSAYKPGAYLSGQRDPDGTGPDGKPAFITTAQDVKDHVIKEHLHPVALWVYDDSCPPAPGCTATPPALGNSGTMDALVWQYAQSPQRPALTVSCGQTYAADHNCYGGASSDLVLDLNVAGSADPSHGR